MLLWIVSRDERQGNVSSSGESLLPFVMMAGAAFVASFLPVAVFQAESFLASLAVAAATFAGLGVTIAYLWPVSSPKLGSLASIPSWLFVFSLHDWSIPNTIWRAIDGIPIILLPVVCFLFGLLGAIAGRKLNHRRRLVRNA